MSLKGKVDLVGQMEQVAQLLDKYRLSDVEADLGGGVRFKISRSYHPQHAPNPSVPVPTDEVSQRGTLTNGSADTGSEISSPPDSGGEESCTPVISPMVGTAYLAPSPGAKPFVTVGSSVKKGQTLLIIEAMKTMNHVQAQQDGVVAKVLVSDAQPVEYGEPLVLIR